MGSGPYLASYSIDEIIKGYEKFVKFEQKYKDDSLTLSIYWRPYENSKWEEVGHVTLVSTPALPYILSTGMWIDPKHQGNAYTEMLDKAKFEAVKATGKGIMASVHSTNYPELARMFKQGWQGIKTRHGIGSDCLIFVREV